MCVLESAMMSTVACLLRCFPNVETLHIMSGINEETTGKLNLKLWQEAGPIESIRSRIKTMTFREFRGDPNCSGSQGCVIVAANGSFTSIPEVIRKVRTLTPENWAITVQCMSFRVQALRGVILCFQAGFEFSISDPFSNST
ncbi:hypothetical protein EJB05_47301 [Eragrostis curvula]|uniref:Uncharacterized protein n=1 Tax=Eragrostis curvula TaxID=38414 RepID=A0A5J9T7D0_9POAL|nr:hypothetical protein EJB05_47301 [Eragrostis curvula]